MMQFQAEPPYQDKARKLLAELSSEEFLRLVEESSAEELQNLALDNNQPMIRNSGENFLKTFVIRLASPPVLHPSSAAMHWQIIHWWLCRGIIFNVFVGLAGLFTYAAAYAFTFGVSGHLLPIHDLLFCALVYGFMANFCFASGPIADLIARSIWKEKAEYFGAILFCFGLAFSLMLTLLPGMILLLNMFGFMVFGH